MHERFRLSPSKALSNKLKQALGVTDCAHDSYLLNEQIKDQMIPIVNKKLPELINTITAGLDHGRKGGKPADVKEIEEGHAGDLVQASVDAIVAKSIDGWQIVMGLGGAEELPAHRLLAVVKEPFLLAERIQSIGFGTPRIRFVKANALAAAINDKNINLMTDVSKATFRWIRAYAERMHPLLIDKLELLSDDPTSVRELIETTLKPLEEKVGPLSVEALRRAQQEGARKRSRIYALAHAFQMEALIAIDAEKRNQWGGSSCPIRPNFVIIIGGAAERHFREAIRAATQHAPTDLYHRTRWLHIVLQAGEKPAYFPYEGEPRIGDGLSEKQAYLLEKQSGIDGDDWKRMLKDPIRAESYIRFLNSWSNSYD